MPAFDPRIMKQLCYMTKQESTLQQDPAAAECESLNYPEQTPDMPDRLIMVTRQRRFVEVPPHQHRNMIELMYVVQGSISNQIGEKDIILQPGDMLMMNQHTVHGMHAPGQDDIAISILIQPRFFPDLLRKIQHGTVLSDFISDLLRQDACWNQYLHFQTGEHLQIKNIMEMLVEMSICQGDPEISWFEPPDVEPEILQTLTALLLLYLSRSLDALNPVSTNNYDHVLLQTVLRYIDTSFPTATLQEAAEILNQSIYSLSRHIKRLTGSTFRELLQKKRFEEAKKLLLHTTLTTGDVAAAVGYENTSYFYNRFRAIYGMSPGEMRQQAASQLTGITASKDSKSGR